MVIETIIFKAINEGTGYYSVTNTVQPVFLCTVSKAYTYVVSHVMELNKTRSYNFPGQSLITIAALLCMALILRYEKFTILFDKIAFESSNKKLKL